MLLLMRSLGVLWVVYLTARKLLLSSLRLATHIAPVARLEVDASELPQPRRLCPRSSPNNIRFHRLRRPFDPTNPTSALSVDVGGVGALEIGAGHGCDDDSSGSDWTRVD